MSRMMRGEGVRRMVPDRVPVDRPRRGGAPSYPAAGSGVGRGATDSRTRPVSSVRPTVVAEPVRACAGAETRGPVAAGPVVLTPRGRLVIALAALVLALAAFAMMGRGADAVVVAGQQGATAATGAGTTAGAAAGADAGRESVLVRPGDTVWTIAERVAPDTDPRVLVDRIKELNDLRDLGALRVGDRLFVPAAGADG